MPLLNSKAFFLNGLPQNYKDDDEVFYCEVTNEIFQDYEQFCERVILINSTVWTCSKTGKKNLTYNEALESEKKAQQNLLAFPKALRRSVIYLASKTQSSSLKDICGDVYHYAKNRFFVGEIVEVEDDTNDANKPEVMLARVVKVKAPTPAEVTANSVDLDLSNEQFQPPAIMYRYEVEIVDKHKSRKKGSKLIIGAENLSRQRGVWSQDRLRLLLKDVMYPIQGQFHVHDNYVLKYDLKELKFTDIFDGPLPEFSVKVNQRGTRQETLTKYLDASKNSKSPVPTATKPNTNPKSLLAEMKRREEELKLRLQNEKLEKIKRATEQKRLARERQSRVAAMVKQWLQPKDDLTLEDHRSLPIGVPVKVKIPSKHFGDCLMIMDFLTMFAELIDTKRFFSWVTFPLIQRALVEKEINGPLTDILRLMLEALFNKQAVKQVNVAVQQPDDCNMDRGQRTIQQEVKLSGIMAAWTQKHQGVKLDQLPLDGLTVTAILRLHLLSSGAQLTDPSLRQQQLYRGGYTNEDDPALELRLNHPEILNHLQYHHVSELSIEDKIHVINCLMNQLLTYDDLRDAIDRAAEQSRLARIELKTLQANEKRRDNEMQAEKTRLARDCEQNKKDNRDKCDAYDKQLQTDLRKIELQNERKLREFSRQVDTLTEQAYLGQNTLCNLGLDRAYRRYRFIPSVPALFVERDPSSYHVEETCMTELTKTRKILAQMETIDEKLAFIKSDLIKDNENDVNNSNNSHSDKENNIQNCDVDGEDNKKVATESLTAMLMCTGDSKNCPVHARLPEPTWYFYPDMESIKKLIHGLNPRGVRENELKDNLINIQSYIERLYPDCPVAELSDDIATDSLLDEKNEKPARRYGSKKYAKANYDFPVGTETSTIMEHRLCDLILELEQQIVCGSLGQLCVNNREKWRECLEKKVYNVNVLKRKNTINGITKIDESPDSDAVVALAYALQTLAYSVDAKFLNCPLGSIQQSRRLKAEMAPCNLLEAWNESLMTCKNFSQLAIHYSTLENSVAFSKSVLYAKCITCRKNCDEQNMLLCDQCNRGQHIYCAKPKLSEIPKDDWFCNECSDAIKSREANKAIDLEQEFINGFISKKSADDVVGLDSDDDDMENNSESDEANQTYDMEVVEIERMCHVCKGTEEIADVMLDCSRCHECVHADCLNPPLKRTPRGIWTCYECKAIEEINAHRRGPPRNRIAHESSDDNKSSNDDSAANKIATAVSRRCAGRKAMNKIHGFARKLRRASTDSNKTNGNYSDHVGDDDDTQSNSSGSEDNSYQIPSRVQSRKNENNKKRVTYLDDDLPLHNAPLQELLSDVLRHPDVWPFKSRVKRNEVPDYLDVIRNPMDIGTIKYKLNIGDYKLDSQVLSHILLVFNNCNTYNNSESEVYKCGVRLFKYIKTRCEQLGFRLPPLPRDNGIYEDAEALEDVDVEPVAKRGRFR